MSNDRPKYFKYLDLWTDHEDFLHVVHESWQEPIQGNPFCVLHQKLKRVSKWLSCWSRQAFGNIYEKPKKLEKQIADLEAALILNNSPEHRTKLNEAKAKYVPFLKLQDKVLRQKAMLKCLEEGNKNTAYFHIVIKGRRRRLNITKIQKVQRKWKRYCSCCHPLFLENF